MLLLLVSVRSMTEVQLTRAKNCAIQVCRRSYTPDLRPCCDAVDRYMGSSFEDILQEWSHLPSSQKKPIMKCAPSFEPCVQPNP